MYVCFYVCMYELKKYFQLLNTLIIWFETTFALKKRENQESNDLRQKHLLVRNILEVQKNSENLKFFCCIYNANIVIANDIQVLVENITNNANVATTTNSCSKWQKCNDAAMINYILIQSAKQDLYIFRYESCVATTATAKKEQNHHLKSLGKSRININMHIHVHVHLYHRALCSIDLFLFCGSIRCK